MSASACDEHNDDSFILIAQTDSTKVVAQLLKAVHFKDQALVFASANGFKITVEESKCVQASAFIHASIFNRYVIKQECVTFKVNITLLLECLNIFGNSPNPLTLTTLKLCYAGYGSPFIVIMKEDGATTSCSIQTHEPDDVLLFDFEDDNIVNKIILQSETLKETFHELDSSSDVMELHLSPDLPNFRLSTFGNVTTFHMEFHKDSEQIESFQCTQTQTNRYKLSLIKTCCKALNASQKVSICTNDQGFLRFQFMIPTEAAQVCFVEHYCSPEEDIEDL